MKDDATLNPQIHKVMIGKKEMKEISLYPFSIKDQMDADTTIRSVVQHFLETSGEDEGSAELNLTNFIMDTIKRDIGKMLAVATGEEDEEIRNGSKPNPLLGEITNAQAAEIADIIFRENYMVAGKKLKGLVEEVKQTFLSKKP